MSRFFIDIYDWFQRHTKIFYTILVVVVAVCAYMASQIRLQENITNFFNDDSGRKNAIFENVKVKDKIIVMLTGENPDDIINSATIFEGELSGLIDQNLISNITSEADEETIARCTSFIYDYLPIFLTDADYQRLERGVAQESVDSAVVRAFNLLTSPSGVFVGDVVMRDPLNIGTHLLQKFEHLNPNLQYEIYNGRIFTKDLTTMLMFVEPSNGMGDTGRNDDLVSGLERAEALAEVDGVAIDCIGGPIVAVYNARQIKRDASLTLSIALVFILVVIFLSFRNKWSIPLIITPPAFGALFAMAFVWLIQGEISAIAIGAGTVVLGISLSYSIHIISHLNHVSSPKEIIEELTVPLTIGCFTTIGAFASLLFTSSALLQDMGLFSVFALIGTTIFCLVFLPQFLGKFDATSKSSVLASIERVVGYRYDGKKWIVLPILLATCVGLFYYDDVEFDDDMNHINYMPKHIADAERRSLEIFGDESKFTYVVTGGDSVDAAAKQYSEVGVLLNELHDAGVIKDVVTIDDFVISQEEQQKRITRWNEFWAQHRAATLSYVEQSAEKCGFRSGAFAQFESLLAYEFTPCAYTEADISGIPVISEWINSSANDASLLCRIALETEQKAKVYAKLDKFDSTAVIDRGYFSSKMVESTSDDFNYILWVSSMIVFLALLLSYGRIELTLLTFLPMAVSWVIILGIMALCDIKFNIVNIILATFIFGIGDDFSIFIMDGLLQEYKNGKQMLGAHKTAIFFSALTAIAGMGVLIFAEHPALKSIAVISVLGLSVVVLVSYTLQPMLFRLFVTTQTKRGGYPYTLASILNTTYCFVYFLLGCILTQIFMLLLMMLPIDRDKKKLAFHKMIYGFTRTFLNTMITVKTLRLNPYNEKYDKPAVIIANHQSFIDILLLLSTTPKLVMVTNSWVWNSPFFGWIVQYADFHHSADGYEALADNLKERVAEGYSVVVFPEGTRSADCSILRFHKGAFYLAQLLKLDILPIIIYGAGQISAKKQGFYIKTGYVATKTMKRVPYGDVSFGETYQEKSKSYRKWFIEQYAIVNDELGRVKNRYFRDAIIKNYIFKGPVLEWYMRVKCRIDGYYDLWDRLIPRNASVTDIGCGYGQMSYMLSMLAPNRRVTGIDYDSDKIDVAQHAFLRKRCNVRFICADMRSVDIPKSDAILFNDSLHYVDAESQKLILQRAVDSLNDGGMIVVRDGDISKSDSHDKIVQTEVWSTQIIRFNKTSENLTFVSSEWMHDFAKSNNMNIKVRSCDDDSSETLYILTRRANEEV